MAAVFEVAAAPDQATAWPSKHVGQRQSAYASCSRSKAAALSRTDSHQQLSFRHSNSPPHCSQVLLRMPAVATAPKSGRWYGQFRQPVSQHELRAVRNSRDNAPFSSSSARSVAPQARQRSRPAACSVVTQFGQKRRVRWGMGNILTSTSPFPNACKRRIAAGVWKLQFPLFPWNSGRIHKPRVTGSSPVAAIVRPTPTPRFRWRLFCRPLSASLSGLRRPISE